MTVTVSPATHLIIQGARHHNLKDVSLTLPKNKLIVFTGLSGSGKSSLAFDTIYAEGQRRYVESLSSYARQFLGVMPKPDVDSIAGLAPSISIDQKTTSHNPRSTVGTITEIYDYLRLLFARIGHPHCQTCGREISPQSVDQIATQIITAIINSASPKPARWYILAPVVTDKKGEFTSLLSALSKKGFERVRIDGRTMRLSDDFLLIKTNRHSIDVILDRLTFGPHQSQAPESLQNELTIRVRRAVEQAAELSSGLVIASQIHDQAFTFPDNPQDFTDHLYSQRLACPHCNESFPDLEPRLFSFNTPEGACPTCHGLGSILRIDPKKIIAPEISLSEGAIIPLASALSTDSWYARKLKVICTSHEEAYTKPYLSLSTSLQNLILNGSSQWFQVSGYNRDHQLSSFSFQWEGIIHELERRYRETQSDFIRTELGRFMAKEICPSCHGCRLQPQALSVTILQKNIAEVVSLSISDLDQFIQTLQTEHHPTLALNDTEKLISTTILKEIGFRVSFLLAVGLNYLTLNREAGTLAGGESQRIRLASQIGTGLTGILYVLDEPTVGLHPLDNQRLIQSLLALRDLGNTVLVVEHDAEVIRSADYLVDFGPGAGTHGGAVVAQGSLKDLSLQPASLTGQYLSGAKTITAASLKRQAHRLHQSLTKTLALPPANLKPSPLKLIGARAHNLKDINVSFPLGQLIVITGVSGSGKSSLLEDVLYPALKNVLHEKIDGPLLFDHLENYDPITKALMIDQSPIGRTPRSNPATYTKSFDLIRDIFSQTKIAREHGYKAGRFSFNVKGGRCESCQGGGEVKISMQFLADLYVTCEVCQGKRYNQETLTVTYQDLNIAQVLNLTVDQALLFFKNHSKLTQNLATLQAVGLGYLKLGQPAPTLSGGEAQRVKLARELSQASTGHTVYLLDEPTTGLHFEDVKNLLVVLKQLVAHHNTVILIEHNLDVIKNADWLIDLGPSGGHDGGQLVCTGTPQTVAQNEISATGRFLHQIFHSKM